MTVRRIALLGVSATLLLTTTACAADDGADPDDTLVIGVSGSTPGLSWLNPDGSFTGFDVDLATYVAEGLGWSERQITFKALTSEQREQALVDGSVDLVVAAYPISAERDEVVDFAGPYLVAGQDLLVPADSTLTGPHSLDGRSVCAAESLPAIEEPEFSPDVRLVEASGNGECVDLLLKGEVDAVTGIDATLAGYAAQQPDLLRLLGSPFSTEYYGVGLPDGSPDVEVVDDLIRRAVDDGTWQADLERNLGPSGWTPPPPG